MPTTLQTVHHAIEALNSRVASLAALVAELRADQHASEDILLAVGVALHQHSACGGSRSESNGSASRGNHER